MKKIINISLYVMLVVSFLFNIFQAYFDLKVRETNGVMISHINVIEKFIMQEFPGQMAHFNDSQKALPAATNPIK